MSETIKQIQETRRYAKLVTAASIPATAIAARLASTPEPENTSIVIDQAAMETTRLLEPMPFSTPIGFYRAADGSVHFHESGFNLLVEVNKLNTEQVDALKMHFQNLEQIANTEDFSSMNLVSIQAILSRDLYRALVQNSRDLETSRFAMAAEYVLSYASDPDLSTYTQSAVAQHKGSELASSAEVEFYEQTIVPEKEARQAIQELDPGFVFIERIAGQLGLNTTRLAEVSTKSTYIVTTVSDAKEKGIVEQEANIAGSVSDGYHTIMTLSGAKLNPNGEQEISEIVFTHEFCHLVSKNMQGRIRYEGRDVTVNDYLLLKSLDYYQNGPQDKYWKILDYTFSGAKDMWLNGWGHNDFDSYISLDALKQGILQKPYKPFLVQSRDTGTTIDLVEEFWATAASMTAANLTYDEIPEEFREILETCVIPEGFNPGLYARKFSDREIGLVFLALSLCVMVASLGYWLNSALKERKLRREQ